MKTTIKQHITKKNIRRHILLPVLILCTINAWGTIPPIVNTAIPPSPTSETFKQFAGYKPSLATGTVNVPIPLYDIQVGGFSLPLSMQYYTQGIKMTDDPYPCGYGWIFSPGLRVTRTIMGRADRYYPMDVRSNATSDFDYCKKAVYDEDSTDDPAYSQDKLVDTCPDIYTVHLPGGDYAFVLEETADGYRGVSTGNLLKIESDHPHRFKVTDEHGVIYHFGNDDTATTFIELYNNRYPTAWMLRKIVIPGTGREISFQWKEVRHSKLYGGKLLGGDLLKDYKPLGVEEGNPVYEPSALSGMQVEYGNYQTLLQLSKIIFPGGQAELSYKETTNPLLASLVVRNDAGRTVKDIRFSYGEGADERLLQRIDFSDEGAYRFEYDATRFSLGNNAQDFWGYYNAKQNQSLVPRMSIKVYDNNVPGGHTSYQSYGYADRTPDEQAMQAYMLTKVIYPTGGYTSFEYEAHRFQGSVPRTEGLASSSKAALTMGGGLRVKKVTSHASGSPDVVRTYEYGAGGNGMANVLYEPTLDTFVDELGGYDGDASGVQQENGYNLRALFINTTPNYSRYVMNTPALWYDTVTEYVEGGGKTVYNYRRIVPENQAGSSVTVKDFPLPTIVAYNNLFSKGCLPVQEARFRKEDDGTYTSVETLKWEYDVQEETGKRKDGVIVNRTGISLLGNGPDFRYADDGRLIGGNGYIVTGPAPLHTYVANPFQIRFYAEQLVSASRTMHYDTGDVEEKSTYTYEGPYLVSVSTLRSDGSDMTEEYLYPKDHALAGNTAQQQVLADMQALNILQPAFSVTRTMNGVTKREWDEYKAFGDSLFLPEKHWLAQGTGEGVCRQTAGYDRYGNLNSLRQAGQAPLSVFWGRNGLYPAAVISGLDYESARSMAGNTLVEQMASTYAPDGSITSSVREAINGNGNVEGFSNEPLVGMTSSSESNGCRSTYNYDTTGRLKEIRENDGHVAGRFHYRRSGDAAPALSFEAAAAYAYNSRATFQAKATGGSGWRSYQWTLKDENGKILQELLVSESAAVTLTLSHIGTCTLTCKMTDGMSRETASCTRTFTVAEPKIFFDNIQRTGGTVSGSVTCFGECTLSLYLNAELQDGTASFSLAGTYRTLAGANGRNEELTLQAGTYYFSVNLSTESRGNRAGIYINGCSPSHKLGTPTFIEAYN